MYLFQEFIFQHDFLLMGSSNIFTDKDEAALWAILWWQTDNPSLLAYIIFFLISSTANDPKYAYFILICSILPSRSIKTISPLPYDSFEVICKELCLVLFFPCCSDQPAKKTKTNIEYLYLSLSADSHLPVLKIVLSRFELVSETWQLHHFSSKSEYAWSLEITNTKFSSHYNHIIKKIMSGCIIRNTKYFRNIDTIKIKII